MKNGSIHIIIIVAALAAGFTVLSFAARDSRGQSARPKSESPVKPTVLVRSTNSPGANPSSPFVAAVAENAILKHDLSWTFGGKPQRGWYLYDLLIAQTLNTQKEPATSEFAAVLEVWQKKAGVSPTGVLDENSFMAMVSQWQNNRLKNRTVAEPDELMIAPSSDFYDPERLIELRQVERKTYAAYKQMVAAAIADPSLRLARTASGELSPTEKYLKIISAFRSREYQDRLRRESPNAGSAGLAVNSPHFTGRALDLYVGGEPVDTKDSNRMIQVNTPAYKWLVRNAARFGFRPYFYEPWHWEYVK